MKYSKPPLTYTDQLALLMSRGLVCTDQIRALQWLKRIGYYRLSAYFIPFRILGTDNFRAGTTLDQIVDLYKFDGNLRLLVLQAMDRIEVGIRSVITTTWPTIWVRSDTLTSQISPQRIAMLN